MGFLDGLGRLVQGKPVFEAPTSSNDHTAPPTTQIGHSSSSPKQLPHVEIEKTESHNNGSHTRVDVDIKNRSDGPVELDKIRLLGTTREIDTVLRAGEERQFVIFEGDRPSHRNYDDAWLEYKDESGDYFQQYHTVEFEQQPDKTYSVKYIRPSGSVKDI